MKKNITSEMLMELAQKHSEDEVSQIYCDLFDAVFSVIKNVSQKNITLLPIENFQIEVVNSFANGSSASSSDLDLLVSIESAQLDINSQHLIKNNKEVFLEKLKFAWQNRKKPSKRQQKKLQKKLEKERIVLSSEPYNISKLKYDIFENVATILPNTCIIYDYPDEIKIISQRELGINFNIIVAIKSGQKYKIWNDNLNAFVEYDYKKLNRLISDKIGIIGENYLKIMRIFNSLYFTITKHQPKSFFVESLILALPDYLFVGDDIAKVFYQILNYYYNKLNTAEIYYTKINELINNKKVVNDLALLTNKFATQLVKYFS